MGLFNSVIWPLLALAAAGALFQFVGMYAEKRLAPPGIRFRSRFPEKPPLGYDHNDLAAFVTQHPDLARLYASPVLFPLDLLVMAAMSAAMAYASLRWFSASAAIWTLLGTVLPAAYFLTDLAEDLLLYRLLRHPDLITAVNVASIKRLTRLKLLFFCAAIVVTGIGLMVVVF